MSYQTSYNKPAYSYNFNISYNTMEKTPIPRDHENNIDKLGFYP